MNGISALLSGWRDKSVLCLSCKCTKRKWPPVNQEECSLQPPTLLAHWCWIFQPPELCDINVWWYLLQHQNWLRQKSWCVYMGEDRKHDIVGTVIWHLASGLANNTAYLSGWFICFYLFQYFKTPVIFLDKPHLFPVVSPTTQRFEMACGDALDNKPVPVWTSKLEFPVLNPHLASLFLCSKSYPFLPSLNLYFILNFSLVFYSILSITFIFGQFPYWLFCLLS